MKRTIGNKLNDYKHLKPPGSEFLPPLFIKGGRKMIDHEKLKQAVKLLEESGADYALGYDCGGYTSYSASMIPDHCNIFDSLMREVIMGAARVVYISDGGLGALRSLDRMSKAITHARRETRFRAGEERVESDD